MTEKVVLICPACKMPVDRLGPDYIVKGAVKFVICKLCAKRQDA